MLTRVLIIDPNIPFMSSLQKALEGTGAFEVSLSANGVAAQESLRGGEFDIAVIDLNVADMDVAELIGRFRQLTPNLRLLVSHTTDEQAHYAARLRVDGTIAKPYMARDLIVRLGEIQSSRTPGDEDLRRQAQTQILRDTPDPGGTDALGDWQDIDRTGSLRKTDMLKEPPSPVDAWLDNEAIPPFFDEPRVHSGDTPTVIPPGLDSLGQFATGETPLPDGSTFDEVLDALSQTPLPEHPPSPDDRAFHELVDSLRAPDSPSRRSTLEDLLTTPPSDPHSLDYVLDAIRRGQPAGEPDEGGEFDLDDTTIRDVIEGLAPEFQDVLALLDGEEVGESDYAEPSYSGERAAKPSHGPEEADRLGLDDLAANDMPDWLQHDAPADNTRRARLPVEPPPSEEDSKHYPATAALNAVTDEDAEFSLDDLLSQIEQQLPPRREQRPHLRPLPSWEENASPEEAERLREIFPPANEWEPGDIEEIFPEPTAATPVEAEPVEVAPAPAPDERLSGEWDAFSDETPADEVLPADFEQLLEQADEAEQDEAERVTLELDLDDDLIVAVQRAAGDDPYVDEPPRDDEDSRATEIVEAFYEGVRQTAYEWDEAPAPTHTAISVDAEWEDEPESEGAHDYAGPRPYPAPEDDEPLPAPSHAARATESAVPLPDEDGEDAARLAQIALELTQFSLESSAQATMLTHGGDVIAQAGTLPRTALGRLQHAIETAWSTSPPDYDSLSRFITLPNLGEFLLFSMIVANGSVLSMIFNANTPVRTIRRQARRLSESLELVPEPPETPEPEASATHASRPTDLRAPEGLRPAPAAEPRRPDTPYTGYTVLWLPWDPRLELSGSYAQALHGWIGDIAAQRAWAIDELAVESDYVQLAVHVPQKNLPDAMLHTLFDETARLTEEHFPELIDGAGRLWANGYYVVTPPRALSEREIGRFVTYQRQAQTG